MDCGIYYDEVACERREPEPSNERTFGGGKLAAASCRHGAMFLGSHNTFSVHESDRSERRFIYCSVRYKLRFHDLDVILWAQSSHDLSLFLIGSLVPGQFVLGSPSVCTEAPSGPSLVIFIPPPVIFMLPTCLWIRRNDIKPLSNKVNEMRSRTRWEGASQWDAVMKQGERRWLDESGQTHWAQENFLWDEMWNGMRSAKARIRFSETRRRWTWIQMRWDK